ncbi:phosphoribosyl-dephospho-CoA transferase MdcG domain-containing protein [Tepidibacillus marianensis]|uniref:phosphoribosyl-dephospho-CoA transferase MdcG domain-containing protein n=1 Tax=Tepidibacillus marianensis TaxID=3131995 RepID=UPI0030D03255
MITKEYNGHYIPAIVRRKEKIERSGMIAVGFSSPFRMDGNRYRIPTFVYEKDIEKIVTPYEVIQKDYQTRTPCLMALKEILLFTAPKKEIKVGVFGSAALEIITNLPYTDSRSDLDLTMKVTDLNLVKEFFLVIKKTETKFGCRVDLEVDVMGIGFKAVELLKETKQLLGKGIESVQLYNRENVIEWATAIKNESIKKGAI